MVHANRGKRLFSGGGMMLTLARFVAEVSNQCEKHRYAQPPYLVLREWWTKGMSTGDALRATLIFYGRTIDTSPREGDRACQIADGMEN